jgi:hypothetical protein
MRTYHNFTELFRELFSDGDTICEIGVGRNVYPYISISEIRGVSYIAVDIASCSDEAMEIVNQIGGLEDYKKIASTYRDVNNLKMIRSLAHNIPVDENSVDWVLFFKTLWKLCDGIMEIERYYENSKAPKPVVKKGFESLREKYRSLGIYTQSESVLISSTYVLLVLDEVGRIARKGIIAIPEFELADSWTENVLNFYSNFSNSYMKKFEVKEPYLEFQDLRFYHWQDNLVRSVYVLFLKDFHREIEKKDILNFLRIKISSLPNSTYRKKLEDLFLEIY